MVTRWTGIPVDKMLEGEAEKLLNMEAQLARRVVGQDDAIAAAAQAERRAREQLADNAASQEERQALRDAPIDLDDLPQFTVARAGLGEVLVSAQTDLLLLLLLNMAFFMGAYMSFLRYDLME